MKRLAAMRSLSISAAAEGTAPAEGFVSLSGMAVCLIGGKSLQFESLTGGGGMGGNLAKGLNEGKGRVQLDWQVEVIEKGGGGGAYGQDSFYVGGQAGRMEKWCVQGGHLVRQGRWEATVGGSVSAIAASSGGGSGGVVAVVGTSQDVVLLSAQDLGKVLARRQGLGNMHKNGVDCLALSCLGSNLVTSAAFAKPTSQAIKLWSSDLTTSHKIKQPHNHVVLGVLFSAKDNDKVRFWSDAWCDAMR